MKIVRIQLILYPDYQRAVFKERRTEQFRELVAPSEPEMVKKEKEKPSLQSVVNSKLSVKKFTNNPDPFGVQNMVTVQDLMNARVHLGHHAGCWTRYIRPYLYGIRNGIHIFNLDTTLVNLQRALNVVGHLAYQRGVILFVNERPQFEALTQFTARKCKEYYVTSWRPGTLTNSFKLLDSMRVPDLMIFLSIPRSRTALKEALTYGIPMVGIVDSDCNPNFVLYPVPGNDDSLQAMHLYCDLFSEVISRAKLLRARDERLVEQEVKKNPAMLTRTKPVGSSEI